MSFIPVNVPKLDGKEEQYLVECIRSGWVSSEGPYVSRFEEQMAQTVNRKFGVAVANGSGALDVAVAALELQPGDEVILPTFTIISCAAAVVRAGATPVLVDCDAQTWNMDADGVAAAITPRTKAIMVVHLYGLPVDMPPLLALAEKHGLKIIEDAAQMLGQQCRGQPCGSFGDLSTFSFYPNKQVTTGEGGMVLGNDEALVERCRSLRNLCFQPQRRFVHEELGWNYRMSNLQAAVGLAQLERLQQTVARKRDIGAQYQSALKGVAGLQTPLAKTDCADNHYWVYGVVLDEAVPFDAAEAMQRLGKLGIGTRPFFWPMHEQPVFQRRGLFAGAHHPNAERLARRGFYLPSGMGLTDAQLQRAAAAVKELLA